MTFGLGSYIKRVVVLLNACRLSAKVRFLGACSKSHLFIMHTLGVLARSVLLLKGTPSGTMGVCHFGGPMWRSLIDER
ncbi:hypothetical protein AXFE_23320 [Acidithrix ferrooxidans]|uniref:Uncharacterized protein n=1 Tax=Acidithrix ferrooxidans TaxID=1280514 RepID=A0A0D8HIF5_9ACTN|nr:hypothetical protein AXFE_23320 [Acidithrix ferrooxidans]